MIGLECEHCGHEVVESGALIKCDSTHECPQCGLAWLVTWCSESEPVLMCSYCPGCGADCGADDVTCTLCGWSS